MKASNAIVKFLEKENVELIFGYPGGAVLPLYEALRESDIKHVLVRNEQSAAHYASGYARETGDVGVCVATSGPGATNLITGIATAYMDSIPIVAITGQVKTHLIGTDAFQEADIKGATEPFTKHNYLVKNAEELPEVFKEAFYLARTGRKGPVLIDLPRDVMEEKIIGTYQSSINIPGYKPTFKGHKGQIRRAISRIKSSQRPVIYAGGGVISAGAKDELVNFAKKTKIPVINSLMGIGSFPQDCDLYVGVVGSHGYTYSNNIVARADLLISVGARLSDRTMAGFYNLNPEIEFVHIDIDPAEIGKNMETNVPIVGDAKLVLQELSEREYDNNTENWLLEIEDIIKTHPIDMEMQQGCTKVNPKKAIAELSQRLDDKACVVADVGQNQIYAALYYKIYGERKYLTSGGLGTMAYSLPAAAGVKLANPEKQVFCIIGDGGIQMCLGELAVIREQNIGVKIIVFNNKRLGMVRNLQHDTYGKNNYFGIDIDYQVDFLKIAQAYDIKGYKVDNLEDYNKVLDETITDNNPCIIQCEIDPEFRHF